MSSIYYYGQDGLPVTKELIEMFKLSSKEYKFSNTLEKDVFDFVGFVFRNNKILVVFPKHYYSLDNIKFYNKEHYKLSEEIKLLFNVIQKYNEIGNSTASGKSHMGFQDGLDSDYPFRAFYEVYDYFQKYGLYKVQCNRIIKGTKGKISWKETLAKSNKIISNGNLIFSTYYTKKKNYNNVFITECMSFIIDYTLSIFKDFFNLRKTDLSCKFDFLNNRDYVLKQLNYYQSVEYKDINKKLINSMIVFFEQFYSKSFGGNIHIRIKYFNLIWQNMIMLYINRHFIGISESTGEALFDQNQKKSSIDFDKKIYNDIDISNNKFSIDIDHLAIDRDKLFIFDSKYYSKIKGLNYKQLAYNELLRYSNLKVKELHNILFLPGEYCIKEHFKYSSRYAGPRKIGLKIMEQYLPIKEIMKDYIK